MTMANPEWNHIDSNQFNYPPIKVKKPVIAVKGEQWGPLSAPSAEQNINTFRQGELCTSASLSLRSFNVVLVLGEANFIFQTQALLCQIVHKYGGFFCAREQKIAATLPRTCRLKCETHYNNVMHANNLEEKILFPTCKVWLELKAKSSELPKISHLSFLKNHFIVGGEECLKASAAKRGACFHFHTRFPLL